MSVSISRAAGITLAIWTLLCSARPTIAQEAVTVPAERTAASVEYVGADGLYLAVGSDQGAERGDTLAVFADAVAVAPMGRLVFISVTRRRAVAVPLEPTLQLRGGDVVYFSLVPPPVVEDPSSAAAAAAPETPVPPRPAGAAGGARLSGRIALDFEARETRTAWTGDLFGETLRRFATPTGRLSLLVTELPGGVALRANLRASYRHDELAAGPPPLSVRAYELAAIKSFDAFPLEVMLGRFGNPYEAYSAYWDGALIRIGRASGLGAGVAAGLEPELYNEAFSRALPKFTAFVDWAGRGAAWRYDTDASFHLARPDGGVERRFVGWSQRLTLGRLSLAQRLRADGSANTSRWSLTELRLRGAFDVVGPLRVRSTFSRARSAFSPLVTVDEIPQPPVRRELTLGLDLSGALGHLSFEGGRIQRDGDQPGLSLYGSSALRMGAVQLLLSGRRWTRGDAQQSWSVAPAFLHRRSSWDWGGGYRLYRTSDGPRTLTSHSAEGQAGVVLAQGIRVALRAERQWGESLSGTRLQLSLWRSF